MARHPSPPPAAQLRKVCRRRLRPLLRQTAALLQSSRPLRLALIAVSVALLALAARHAVAAALRGPPFDDVADMAAVAAADEAVLAALRNSTAARTDPNATRVLEARASWHHVYGVLQHKPVPPTLTPYKRRVLRELLSAARLALRPMWSPLLNVSCMYLNAVEAPGGRDAPPEESFSCMPTSHRCADGGVAPTQSFVPAEGVAVTWAHVVLMLLVAPGRDAHIAAVADTWLGELPTSATVVFVRDGKAPTLPSAVMRRPNTHVFEYAGPPGLDNLDMKAFRGLSFAFDKFGRAGKKYFIKLDDDTFLFRHNLLRFLNHVERRFSPHEAPVYFGHPFCGHGDLRALDYATYCYAGGGAYGLSVEAVEILLRQIAGGCAYFYDYVFKAADRRPENDAYGGRYEDVMVGRCIRQARTRSQLRGASLLACGSFVPYAPLHYYERFGRTKEALENKLAGDPITVHNLAPSAMRFVNQLLCEYPLNSDVGVFLQNNALQSMIDKCSMNGKKMECDLSA